MAAVKANAYGHGAVPVARALEAGRCRCAGGGLPRRSDDPAPARISSAPIALLEGMISAEEAALAVYERLHIVVHDHWQIALAASGCRTVTRLAVWFKLDTGMHRLGFPRGATCRALRGDARPIRAGASHGWITHLACADEPDNRLHP